MNRVKYLSIALLVIASVSTNQADAMSRLVGRISSLGRISNVLKINRTPLRRHPATPALSLPGKGVYVDNYGNLTTPKAAGKFAAQPGIFSRIARTAVVRPAKFVGNTLVVKPAVKAWDMAKAGATTVSEKAKPVIDQLPSNKPVQVTAFGLGKVFAATSTGIAGTSAYLGRHLTGGSEWLDRFARRDLETDFDQLRKDREELASKSRKISEENSHLEKTLAEQKKQNQELLSQKLEVTRESALLNADELFPGNTYDDFNSFGD